MTYKFVATEAQIQKLMDKLGCTREEALEIIREDAEVDKMTVAEAHSDLTEEQKKASKSATITGSKKRTPVKRERKVDEDKKLILEKLFHFIRTGNFVHMDGEPSKKNESEIYFTFKSNSYTIKLIKHRPPKK